MLPCDKMGSTHRALPLTDTHCLSNLRHLANVLKNDRSEPITLMKTVFVISDKIKLTGTN